jgi:hypothetical protein
VLASLWFWFANALVQTHTNTYDSTYPETIVSSIHDSHPVTQWDAHFPYGSALTTTISYSHGSTIRQANDSSECTHHIAVSEAYLLNETGRLLWVHM